MSQMPDPADDTGRSLLHKSKWSAIASACSMAGFLASSVLTSRLLGPVGTGQVAYATWLAGFIAMVAGLGLPPALSRFVAEAMGDGGGKERGLLSRAARMYLGLVVASAVVAAVAYFLLQTPTPTGVLGGVFAAYYLAAMLNSFGQAYLAGSQQFVRSARLAAVSSVIHLGGIALGGWFFGVAGIIGGTALGLAPVAMLCLGLVRRRETAGETLTPEFHRRFRRYAWNTWLATNISAITWTRTEVFFLARYHDAREVAMFSVGLSLATMAIQGPSLFCGALMPHMTARLAAHDEAGIRELYASITRLLAFAVMPVCWILAAATPVVLPWIFGARFAPAANTASVLIITASIGATVAAGSALQAAMERSGFIVKAGCVGALLTVTGALVVIPSAGAWGAAWVRGVVQLAMVALGTWYTVHHMKCPFPLMSVLGTVFCAAVAAALVRVGVMVAPGERAITVGAIVGGGLVYLLLVRLAGTLEVADIGRLGRAVHALPLGLGVWGERVCRLMGGRP